MEGTEKPTRIMYETNVSWNLLTDILSSLTFQGFIEEIENKSKEKKRRKKYRITEKGESVVQYHRKAEQLFKIY